KPGRSLYRLDLGGQQEFLLRSKAGALLQRTGAGALPQGWDAYGWDKDTTWEVGVERCQGSLALALRNLDGKQPSAMLFSKRVPWKAGGRYRVRVEYLTQGSGRGFFKVQEGSNQARALGNLEATHGTWRVQEFRLDQAAAGDGRFEFHALDVGAEHTLYVRS